MCASPQARAGLCTRTMLQLVAEACLRLVQADRISSGHRVTTSSKVSHPGDQQEQLRVPAIPAMLAGSTYVGRVRV